MRTRPSFISEPDWRLLLAKYDNDKKLDKILKRIENDYPIQYAIGYVDFYKTSIEVNKNVLVPRFETELLVDILCKEVKNNNLENANILDLCTGSGCIGISLANEFKNANVTAVDKSSKALKTARKNAEKNRVKIQFLKKDVLKDFKYDKKFQVLVSNPPYVKLDEEVSNNTKYEPTMALYPGKDDVIFYKAIIDYADKIMEGESIIAFEIGSTQAIRICEYAKNRLPLSKIKVLKDYNNYDRFILIYNYFE